jgi:Spy/CpxP family protein refolding chaperone
MNRLLPFVPFALVALSALPASAQPPHRVHGEVHHDLAQDLGLSEEQQAQWRAAHEAHRAAIEPLLEQLEANHEAVEAAIETGDPTTVGEAVLAGRAVRSELEAARDTLEETVLEILDDEQEALYQEHRHMRRRFDAPGHDGHLRRRGPAPVGQ